jgi:hypothetical protein
MLPLASGTMAHEEIVQENLQRELHAGTRQTTARKPTQPPTFFDICKHDFDHLTPAGL